MGASSGLTGGEWSGYSVGKLWSGWLRGSLPQGLTKRRDLFS
jgi:hypothetical protein